MFSKGIILALVFCGLYSATAGAAEAPAPTHPPAIAFPLECALTNAVVEKILYDGSNRFSVTLGAADLSGALLSGGPLGQRRLLVLRFDAERLRGRVSMDDLSGMKKDVPFSGREFVNLMIGKEADTGPVDLLLKIGLTSGVPPENFARQLEFELLDFTVRQ